MVLPVDYSIEQMQPLTIKLCDQALSASCICGQLKILRRPFCDRCMGILDAYHFKTEVTRAWHECLQIEAIRVAGFMFSYDLCCDVLDAIKTGRFKRERKKKDLDHACRSNRRPRPFQEDRRNAG